MEVLEARSESTATARIPSTLNCRAFDRNSAMSPVRPLLNRINAISSTAALQREIGRNLVVEASYVANRGNWWSAAALSSFNDVSQALLSQYGFNVGDVNDRAHIDLICADRLGSVNRALVIQIGGSARAL